MGSSLGSSTITYRPLLSFNSMPTFFQTFTAIAPLSKSRLSWSIAVLRKSGRDKRKGSKYGMLQYGMEDPPDWIGQARKYKSFGSPKPSYFAALCDRS